MIGELHGRLTVVAFSHKDQRQRRFWLVRCGCGNEKTVQTSLLRNGNTQSCGCLRAERLAEGRTRLPKQGGVVNQLILGYRRHARDRGLSWNLTRELFDLLIRRECHYCGDPGSNVKTTKNYLSGFRHNGLDRRDPSRGYEPDNVVPACKTCNLAKRDLTEAAFMAWASRLAAMAAQWTLETP